MLSAFLRMMSHTCNEKQIHLLSRVILIKVPYNPDSTDKLKVWLKLKVVPKKYHDWALIQIF